MLLLEWRLCDIVLSVIQVRIKLKSPLKKYPATSSLETRLSDVPWLFILSFNVYFFIVCFVRKLLFVVSLRGAKKQVTNVIQFEIWCRLLRDVIVTVFFFFNYWILAIFVSNMSLKKQKHDSASFDELARLLYLSGSIFRNPGRFGRETIMASLATRFPSIRVFLNGFCGTSAPYDTTSRSALHAGDFRS